MNEKIEQLLEYIHEWFLKREKTLGFAESCTGGLMSSLLAQRPGVSSLFMGSVVSYSNFVKKDALQVPEHLLAAHGAVSIPVVRSMARGARSVLGCDWSVAITGVAGPNGGSQETPVGTVCFAVSGPGFEEAVRQRFQLEERNQIQEASVHFALQLLKESIQ